MNLDQFSTAVNAALLILLSQSLAVQAAELKVLSAVAVKTALDDLTREFERTTGHKVVVAYATAGQLRDRIQNGEAGDMTILPRPAFEPLVAQGKINSGSQVILARSTVGVSVRSGAPKPDISSIDAVRRSLLAAKSIVYTDPAAGGLSGVHFVRVLERLGIVEEMKLKTKLTTVASGIARPRSSRKAKRSSPCRKPSTCSIGLAPTT